MRKARRPAPAAGKAGDGTKPNQGDTQITKIEAKGDVIINSDEDQTTTSDWALYDLPAQLVTVGGNVVLTQGKNVLKGDRLVIDLTTGESRFENTGNTAAGGRIRALFMPKGRRQGCQAGRRQSRAEREPRMRSLASDSDKPTQTARSLTRTQATRPRRLIAGTSHGRSSSGRCGP